MEYSFLQIFDIWSEWVNGSTGDWSYLGVSKLWWARISKVIQFLGTLTILVEIIGEARFRLFKDTIAREFSGHTFESIVDIPEERWPLLTIIQIAFGSMVTIFLLWSYILVSKWGSLSEVIDSIVLFFGYVFLAIAAFIHGMFLIAMGGHLFTMLTGVIISRVILTPILFILRVPSLNAAAKSFALVTIVLGFHFDLLTS